jgi:hypothetical protein
MIQSTYDEMLPSDLKALEAVGDRQLVDWYHNLNGWRWPAELAPEEPNRTQTHEEWKAAAPDRRDDIMEWIKNRVGAKYCLMIWQTERMLAHIAPGVSPSDASFEEWWNEPYPGDPSITKGEHHLRSAEWWARTREEWRAARKARQAHDSGQR